MQLASTYVYPFICLDSWWLGSEAYTTEGGLFKVVGVYLRISEGLIFFLT
jgi:hypothetical protein